MRTIWKYKLPSPECTLAIPRGSIVRRFDAQGDDLCIWVEVVDDAPVTTRAFIAVNTGHMIPPDERDIRPQYRGTATVRGIVWHLYEGIPPIEETNDG